MAKRDRTGKRKPRKPRGRTPELGYYIIVTDTDDTERFYFQGLRDSIPEEYRDKIVIKVRKTKTTDLLGECKTQLAYDPQYRMPWIVFDRDQVTDFDEFIERAEQSGIHVGWSNPCFEIWMFAYFNKMPKIEESKACVSEFAALFQKETGQEYVKSDVDIYRKLCEYGQEEAALQMAESKYAQCIREGMTVPSKMCSATTVYQLVNEIRRKTTSLNGV